MRLWIDETRGHLFDWLTQRWVWLSGRSVSPAVQPWLDAPVGGTRVIGRDVFARYAAERGLELCRAEDAGLVPDLSILAGETFEPAQVHPAVRDFYQKTGTYALDAWSEWSGVFRPFGGLLAAMFSRRLQQLNVPLSPLDTSRGITSEIVQLRVPGSAEVSLTAWIRQLVGSGDVLYSGGYSVVAIPNLGSPCVRVTFPLPNGNALVFLRPESHDDGSLSMVSRGAGFGEPGFYFTVHDGAGVVKARYVRALREAIRVYPAGQEVRADHTMWLWNRVFMRLHYRMRSRAESV